MALRPSPARAAVVAWLAAATHGGEEKPSCLQVVVKSGEAVMFETGLLGGRIGCDDGSDCGVGGWVVGEAAVARGVLADVRTVVEGTGAVSA
ncbi:MAG TPA: hypothetical protein VN820_06715, partial [Acidimicrobiales bacterium]|nr:hypothetical protein [Acidimicrobiales bacterium]